MKSIKGLLILLVITTLCACNSAESGNSEETKSSEQKITQTQSITKNSKAEPSQTNPKNSGITVTKNKTDYKIKNVETTTEAKDLIKQKNQQSTLKDKTCSEIFEKFKKVYTKLKSDKNKENANTLSVIIRDPKFIACSKNDKSFSKDLEDFKRSFK